MNVWNSDKCVTCLTLGSLHLSERLIHPKEVTSTFNIQIIKKEGRKRGRDVCVWELNGASHRGFGSESNNSLHQLMLTWAASKWGLGINPVISHTVSILLPQWRRKCWREWTSTSATSVKSFRSVCVQPGLTADREKVTMFNLLICG